LAGWHTACSTASEAEDRQSALSRSCTTAASEGGRVRRTDRASTRITGKRLMKHATSRELYDYWDRLRRGQPAPHRSDIEPSDIRRILADTFILEVPARETYAIRLAGTRICALYGREIKGPNFLDLWTSDDRQAIATLAAAVSTDAAAAVLSLEGHTARRRTLACELLLLPLRHGKSGYDRVLGSLAP